MEKPRDARVVSRVFAAHALGVGQKEEDTLLLMRYKRFNGYLDYLNTFVYMVRICLEIYELMPVLSGTKCI